MAALNSAAFFIFQDDLTRHDIHWAMICLAVIAGSLLFAAIALIVGGLFAYKLFLRVDKIGEIVEHKIGPILDKTSAIMADLGPKVQSVTENVEQISYTVRGKVDELGVTISHLKATVDEINGRTRVQVSRVDGIVTEALIATQEISANVQHSIRVPVKQIAGVVAGVKAGLETLIARSPFGGNSRE